MKRRTFILTTAVVLGSITIPLLIYRKKIIWFNKPLEYPESLARLFDQNAIAKTGTDYRLKYSSENDIYRLKELLLRDSFGKTYNVDDKMLVREMLKCETKRDFEIGRTVVLNRWVLSVTEARQCALFSLISA